MKSDQGFTLIELLVVMVLVGIIGSFVTVSIVSGMNVARATSQRATALHDIERALQVVGRELRVADPVILDADRDFGTSIAAQVYRDGYVQVHSFTIESTPEGRFLFHQINEYASEDVGPDGPGDATPLATLPRRRLVTDVDNELDTVFTYYNELGGPLRECPEDEELESCARPAQVGIELIRLLPRGEEIRADTRIMVRNMRYGTVQS